MQACFFQISICHKYPIQSGDVKANAGFYETLRPAPHLPIARLPAASQNSYPGHARFYTSLSPVGMFPDVRFRRQRLKRVDAGLEIPSADHG